MDFSNDELSQLPKLSDAAAYWDGKFDASAFSAEVEAIGRADFCKVLGIAESTLSGWLAEDRVPAIAKVAYGELRARQRLQDALDRLRSARTAVVSDGESFQIVSLRRATDGSVSGNILARDIPDEPTARLFAGAQLAVDRLCSVRRKWAGDLAENGVFDIYAEHDEAILRDALCILGPERFATEYLSDQISKTLDGGFAELVESISTFDLLELNALMVLCGSLLAEASEGERRDTLRSVLKLCELGVGTGTTVGDLLPVLLKKSADSAPPEATTAVSQIQSEPRLTPATITHAGLSRRNRRRAPSGSRASRIPSFPKTLLIGERLVRNRAKSDAEILALCSTDRIETKIGTVKGLRGLIAAYEECRELTKLSPEDATRWLSSKARNSQLRVGLVWFRHPNANQDEFHAASVRQGINASKATTRQIWRYFPLCKKLLESNLGD